MGVECVSPVGTVLRAHGGGTLFRSSETVCGPQSREDGAEC